MTFCNIYLSHVPVFPAALYQGEPAAFYAHVPQRSMYYDIGIAHNLKFS